MPKKFTVENPKVVAVRVRKKAAKDAELCKTKQADEDAYWKDDSKQVLKKRQKKDEQERRKQESLRKKTEVKALLENEMLSLTAAPVITKAPSPKLTRAQINTTKTARTIEKPKKKIETHLDVPLTENINRLKIEGEEARSVREAIAILSQRSEETDKHPEKRMKAAYAAYEKKRFKELKEENHSLRLSQLKEMVFKEWQKSPENPLNQKT